MAVVPAPPIPLTGPGTYSIPYPGGGTQPQGASGQWTQIKLENTSPFGLTLSLGGTPVYSLPAGIADVFPLTLGPGGLGATLSAVNAPAQPLTVTAATPAGTTTASSGTLRPSFGQYGDVFPGSYPVTLPATVFTSSAPVSFITPGVGILLAATPLTVPAAGSVSTGVISLANTETVVVEHSATAVSIVWTVIWYQDAAGTISLGSYSWQSNTVASHMIPIASQGPYMVVQVQCISGGPASAQVAVTGFPSLVNGGLLVPPQPAISIQGLSVPGPGNTGARAANLYIPGRYHIWVTGTQAMLWRLETIDSGGNQSIFWQSLLVATSAPPSDFDLILPSSDWKLTGFNQSSSTASTVFASLVGPL